MKKSFTVLITLLIVFSLAACGSSTDKDNSESDVGIQEDNDVITQEEQNNANASDVVYYDKNGWSYAELQGLSYAVNSAWEVSLETSDVVLYKIGDAASSLLTVGYDDFQYHSFASNDEALAATKDLALTSSLDLSDVEIENDGNWENSYLSGYFLEYTGIGTMTDPVNFRNEIECVVLVYELGTVGDGEEHYFEFTFYGLDRKTLETAEIMINDFREQIGMK
jgi:hypothetical protein